MWENTCSIISLDFGNQIAPSQVYALRLRLAKTRLRLKAFRLFQYFHRLLLLFDFRNTFRFDFFNQKL